MYVLHKLNAQRSVHEPFDFISLPEDDEEDDAAKKED